MDDIKRSYSREEFHELVWSTPIEELASRFGVTTNLLIRICHNYLVPVPPKRYREKIEAGETPKKTSLRAVENASLHIVTIAPPQAKPSVYATTIVEAAIAASEGKGPPVARKPIPISSPPRERSSSVLKKAAADRNEETSAPSNLATPSPVKIRPEVAAFIAELRSLRPDRDGFVYLKYVKVPPADLTRVASLISSIAADLAPHGFVFSTEGRIGFAKEGTKVDFAINAPRKRVKNTSKNSWYTFDYLHVGRFTLEIYGCAAGIGKNWADSDTRKIEQSLPKIVESFRINFVAEKERDEKRRREEELRAHTARRRQLASLREKREGERLEFLRWIADARREVDDLQETIAKVPKTGDLPPDYQRMISWAETRLAALEAETSAERIQATLVERKLYPEPDDLFDPEGDPPPKTNYWDD
ncbi:hypothetical protein [Rhizobium sp. NXC24]|uniref:hypothetical protein n=1 Tax=Rhizobium sp. NXC24 TaxID=2048897 RepID=UPI00131A4A92|nr:hypothetical protein [Rhizobium sp. NXC24]